MKKKIVSVLLILTMAICMMPYMAFADEPVQTEVYSVSVDFTSQKAGSFLHAPQFGYEVSSDLAESYGYPDAAGAVSVMDVLVSAHELVYGGDFTPETAEDYLTVSDGRVTKMFDYVFPAETFGGLKTIKALSGPFPQIKFIPTGGINQNNAAEYFRNPKIQAVGGSWMVTKDMVAAGDFEGITAKSKAATDLFKEIRG